MITGLPGLLLNSFSIIVLSAVLVIALLILAFYCRFNPWHALNAEARQTGLWLLVISPWLTGLIASAIVMSLSNANMAGIISNEIIHWHHPDTFTLTSWHGYFVLATSGLAAFISLRIALRLIRSNTTIRTLLALAKREPDGVHILETETPAAFTAGLKNPVCFMTSALIKNLNEDEYTIIKLHEQAHARRRDPIRKTLFLLLTAIFPDRIAQKLNQVMNTALEQSADAAVSSAFPDKAIIARTLVKARRLSMQPAADDLFLAQACHYSVDDIDQRIHYLLTTRKGRALPKLFVFSLIAVVAIACALGADAIHHAVEIPLHHI